ncbi:hypothetical protein PTSG_05658 [Salpingoeca rosetta]|uniref:Cytochrome P450 n=1 Tax=Salpingoeca rosetta (strain ATCC 50818 / BSB-021) TaxID=946362 RepID=F2UBU8_SALR5|nr:uncharacterized protein PTSG_05658 [Salpingoeca rosetta]EGD73964.1 hypothetical protein PTSG_05658 [Salpingoeca rosetta]|eukprot:XP_004993527.1 hypothetical protein PTSG_05658 [Salpingoeca rosetta]
MSGMAASLSGLSLQNAGGKAKEAWTGLVDTLRDGFTHRPVVTALKCAGALVAIKVAVDTTRYVAEQWSIGSALRSLPRATGSLPFLGHALRLNVESPWDVMETWIKSFNYNVMALDFFGKETLRYYTLVPVVTREAVEEDDLCGVRVPAGCKVFIHIKAVHNNPEVWEKPRTFMPERFEKEHDPCAFLPFIVGPRNCLGQHLALLEARIVMALMMLRFDFEPAQSNVGEKHGRTVPVCPKHGMWLNVKAR